MISVIIPAYNVENSIEAAVKSIQAQSCLALEIILVDDGSTDGTPGILDRLALTDERIKVIHQANGGVTCARLRGVSEAAGEWIGFVDGDDTVEPEMYAVLLKNALDSHADISHCGHQNVFPDRTDYFCNTGRKVRQDKKAALRELLSGSFEPSLWNKLYRRGLFRDLLAAGLMDTSIRINEDLLMNYYLFREAESSVFEDVCLYRHFMRRGSASHSGLNQNRLGDPLRVAHILESELSDEPGLRQIVRERIVAILVSLATLPEGDREAVVRPYREEARRELRDRLPSVLKQGYSAKHKIFALWASVWPGSYRWVHGAYARLRGTDKKYAVE